MILVTRADYVIDDDDDLSREWRRSRRSYGSGQCVEAAAWSGTRVDVRDSKNPRGAVLRFTPAQWNNFVAGVRSGALGL
jgi:Domain of unknown function (DUF397)